jgi:hypothetical protein
MTKPFYIVKNIMHNRDTDFMASHHLSTLLMTQPLNGGFIDVHQHRVTIPIGWGGKLGQVHAQNFGAFLQSIHPLLKNQLIHDNTAANVDDLLIQAVKECSANQSHMKWFVCYGQKPADMLGITPPLPCSSVKNSISMQYPTNTAQMITPNASPSLKGFQQKEEDESTWDSINDFVDGYID